MNLRPFIAGVLLVALLPGCDRKPRAMAVQVGQSLQGRLQEGDWTDVFLDGSYTDLYEISLAAGQQITVSMSSSDFDTYLSLMRGPGDQLVDNDDAQEGRTDSQLSYQAEAPGRYFIAATSFGATKTGPYDLQIVSGQSGNKAKLPPGP